MMTNRAVFSLNNKESLMYAKGHLEFHGILSTNFSDNEIVELANKLSAPNKLFGKSVKCLSLADYTLTRFLFMNAGANIWGWHEGFKPPEKDIHDSPYYGWEPAGFIKHILVPHERDIIELSELNTLVFDFKRMIGPVIARHHKEYVHGTA